MKAVVDEPIRFKNFNSSFGLSNDWVNSITEDDRGFLWIATRNGLNVYDGNENIIHQFDHNNVNSLSHNDVSEVKYVSSGYVFVGTWGGGLNLINSRTRHITRVGNTDYERSLTIKSIVEDDDSTVWVGTYGQGVYKYDFKTNGLVKCKEKVLSEEAIYCQDLSYNNDTLWIVTRGKGLAFIPTKGDQKLAYALAENKNTKIPNDLTYLSFIDDVLYMGTYNGQVLTYDRNTCAADTLLNLNRDSEHSNRVNSVFQDKNKNLWMSTSSGLFKYSMKTEVLSRIRKPETGEEYNDNFCSYIDTRGIFWLGNWGSGLYSYSSTGDVFKTITLAKPNKNIVQAIQPLNDSVFLFGTASGVLEYDLNSRKVKKINAWGEGASNISNNIVNGILPYNDQFLIATDGSGLFLMDRKYHVERFTNDVNSNLFNASIIGVNELSNGDRLIGSWAKGGVLLNEKLYTYREFSTAREKDPSIQCNTAYCAFLTKDGRTLVGTEGGILEYSRKTNDFKQLPLFVHINSDKSPLKSVRSIVEDEDGFLWAASISGLVKYNMTTYQDEELLTEENGLINKTIHNMILINGSIWATTKGGLIKIDTKTNKATNFTVIDGLAGNAFNDNGLLYKNGILYLASGYDIIYFEPEKVSKLLHPARLEFLNFRLNDKVVNKVGGKHVSTLERIELKYKQNNVSFDISVIDFLSNKGGKFAHKLEGFDDKWVEHNYTDTKIRYTNLEAGEYTLVLAPILEDNTISGVSKSITLYVSPPFWETIWFRILALILAGSVLAIYIRLRTKRVIEENKKLEEEVSKRTTELSLSHLKLLEKSQAVESNIKYASVLQEALLTKEEVIKSGFEEFFIFNKPKDGVSGDFFWFTKVDDRSIFVVADCTGHGVSGAFVSVFGVSSLRSIVEARHIIRPDLILNELHKSVTSAFHQNETTVRDGMDISVISYDEKSKILEISSAKASPLFVMDNQDLIRLKGDKFPIGGSDENYPKREDYVLKTMKVTSPSTLYLFSDGFQDQFGGVDSKKYMQRQFREFLHSNCNEGVVTQKERLIAEFNDWKGQNKQVDDVLVVGIKLG